VGESRKTTENCRDAAGGTLGDLLYADRTKPRVSEKEWVALVKSIAAGDQQALHALFQRMHRIVFTLIMRITRTRETAEELTLDVFHDVWRNASKYEPAGGTVVGWILNQARSRAIDRVRFEQRKKRTEPNAGEALSEPVVSGPDEALRFAQQGQLLRGALMELTPAERESIESAFFSGLTYSEVAAQLSQPLGTVKTRIRSGLEKLRNALAPDVQEP
jgi:RNA polymerase sigma-70 factor (ECF subfamily)